jgi:hypothetical protein
MFNSMKTKIQIVLSALLVTLAMFMVLAPNMSVAKAAGGCNTGDTLCREKQNKSDCVAQDVNANNCGIIKLLDTGFNLVSGAISLAIIGNIIYAGIQYSMAQGDPSKAQKSKDRIRNAVIAFLMYISLYAFIQWLIPGGVF